MTMTLGTFHCASEPGSTGGVNPIHYLIYAVCLGVYACFYIAGRSAVKSGCDLLFNRRIGE